MTMKQKYEKVFAIINELGLFDSDIYQLKSMAERYIFADEVRSFGLPIEHYNANGWYYSEVSEYAHIVTLDGKEDGRNISWPYNGVQLVGRFLIISFSNGPYIFGDDYPKDLFTRFFDELKSLNPASVDSANNSLYFKMEDAGQAHKQFKEILKKYGEENRVDRFRRKAIKAQKELDKIIEQLPPAGSP